MLIKPINHQTQLNLGCIWGSNQHMRRKRIIVRSYITLLKMINDTSFASTPLLHRCKLLCARRLWHMQLIIPLSINADVYAYAFLLAAALLCMIACFIMWYSNRCCGLVNGLSIFR